MDSGLEAATAAFNSLNALGLGLATLFLLIAAFSKGTARLQTWYLILGFSGSLSLVFLVGVGKQRALDTPDTGGCLFQAGLMYAVAAGIACSVAAFTVQLYLSLRYFILNTTTRIERNNIGFTIFPMVIFVLLVLMAVLVAITNPLAVGRDGSFMFCHMRDPTPVKVTGVIVVLSSITILVMQGMIVKLVYPHWKETAALRVRSNGVVSRSLLVRLILWDITALLAVAVGVVKAATNFKSPIVNILIGCINLAEIVAFGSATVPWGTVAKWIRGGSTGGFTKMESSSTQSVASGKAATSMA